MLLVAGGTNAAADIVVGFDSPDQLAQPGDIIHFFGTINNTGADTVFFNGDDINFVGAPSLDLTDLFFANVPISLDGGFSSGDIELFSITLANPFNDPFVLYPGSYTLTGGIDGSAQDILASANFSVTPQEPSSTVPEPATVVLLLTAILLLFRRATLLRSSLR